MTLIKRFVVFSVIGIVGCGSLPALQAEVFGGDGISARIQQVPLEDRCVIEAFFREFLFQDDGAYVLFGTKPIALSGYYYMEESYLNHLPLFALKSSPKSCVNSFVSFSISHPFRDCVMSSHSSSTCFPEVA